MELCRDLFSSQRKAEDYLQQIQWISFALNKATGKHMVLFIHGSSLLSQERTTQGDPLAMPMYAICHHPLIRSLPSEVQWAWYADDASASGGVSNLSAWWDDLVALGPACECHQNLVSH